ncbi:MAG: hypothetical protein V7607_5424 [Solirubrobacteraceae bacterium]
MNNGPHWTRMSGGLYVPFDPASRDANVGTYGATATRASELDLGDVVAARRAIDDQAEQREWAPDANRAQRPTASDQRKVSAATTPPGAVGSRRPPSGEQAPGRHRA